MCFDTFVKLISIIGELRIAALSSSNRQDKEHSKSDTAILYWTYRAELTNDPSFRVKPKMNDSEAACFAAEALEYHFSVCDLVRLAVRPVNSDFDIFIRILFYLNNKWREDASKLSRPRHGLVNTKTTTGSSETWSFFFFFFGGGGGGAFEPKRHGLLCGHRLKSICVRF